MNIIAKLVCKLKNHQWNWTHGFKDIPEDGARCYRCGKING